MGLMKVSQLMGMDIFTDNAVPMGKVYDVIIDLQKGEIVRLTMEPISASSKEEAKKVFKERTVMYRSVKAVDRIILVSNTPISDVEEAAPEPTEQKPLPYSHKYRRSFGK
ncbi:hypothetical protein COY71_03275 [Candidatus Micrarchaeota archaeon CG_4_10_14_0_8_um_filter_60_7]|nr:MAG: hypothetical protein COY71_03275 [Candidatus Micrarchaeota archaeon CG_4_10_14_0_8_um_filter_60_7]